MVQLSTPPPRKRFDRPQQRSVNLSSQTRQLPRRKQIRSRTLRYRLLVLKVRIKVFFIKARRRPRLTSGVLASVAIAVTIGIIFIPHKAQSVTELEYFQQQLDRVKTSVQLIKDQNPTTSDVRPLANQIENYKDSLVDSLGACEQIDTQAEQINKQVMKDYLQAVEHARQFCGDYEDVADYARKVSKATKQFIVLPVDPIRDSQNTASITELIEVIGYTQTDLKKLDGSPLDDPALEEMIITIDDLQKLAMTTQQSPTASSRQKLADETLKQQINLLRARVYFWNNSIKIDPLNRSVIRLRAEFNVKS